MSENKRKIAVILLEEDEEDDDLSLSLSLFNPRRKYNKSAPSSSSFVSPVPTAAHSITDPFLYKNVAPPSTTLSLSLSPTPFHLPPPPAPTFSGLTHEFNINHMVVPPQRRRGRRNPSNNNPGPGKPLTIPPPFPWSGEIRATVVTVAELTRRQILSIEGQVQCKRCDVRVIINFQLNQSIGVVIRHVIEILAEGNNRAPQGWATPKFPPCPSCMHANCMKPIIAQKKRDINWLFMYLGETLGTCNLEQLKYFCKHNKMHRTGSKMHLLLYAYIGISKQLHPTGPFNVII
ncbi:hydroxyproline-rich glycoprotein family protein [Zostera marina]|uniref:Hydroxyproline-rich glycoprotein family protein n=1 Tax=Zostera marina TaxID=29655 RepID=A0A0K9NZ89_ZOSMR|nr:hydroxyproline-rich glycoprotein family protein [Zostera marina]